MKMTIESFDTEGCGNTRWELELGDYSPDQLASTLGWVFHRMFSLENDPENLVKALKNITTAAMYYQENGSGVEG